jgi:FkbM family methyltransferase
MKKIIRKLLSRTPYVVYNKERRSLCPLEDIRRLHGMQTSMVILDVGANEGQSALAFRAKYPEALIHSFEPINLTYAELKRNTNDDKKIFCHNYALGDVRGQVIVNIQQFSQINSIADCANKPIQGGAKESVKVCRLSDVCEELGLRVVDLLKTDTEGFDVNVLKGGESMLNKSRIKMILTEVGLLPNDPQHTPLSAVLNYLESRGFYLYGLYDLPVFGAGRSVEYCNALFVLRNDE